MELLSYEDSSEHFIRDGVFDHRGGRYRGKGWLRWDPATGARIDLAVERTGPALTGAIGFGFEGWLRPEDYTTIRMRIDGFDWVIAPHVGLVDRLDVLLGSHLSVDVKRLISRRSQSTSPDTSSGHVALALPSKPELFTPLREATFVNGREVESHQAPRGAIDSQLDGLEVLGTLDEGGRARVSWRATDEALPRSLSWSYGHALRAAISMCTGCGARAMERGLCRSGHVYNEMMSVEPPGRLGMIAWFRTFEAPDADECVMLSQALVRHPSLLTTSWGAFSQLLASREQSEWGISELLVATAMEGLLRSLQNRPFRRGETYNLKEALLALRETHFPSVSVSQCDAAMKAYRRLRHRNAHPDWLTSEERLSRDVLTQSSADMEFLSKLYGRVLFEAAGLPQAASRIILG